jgi:tellurite resistance protein TerC
MIDEKAAIPSLLRKARRLIVLVIGSTVLLIGLALLILPGPAFVVIPLGLAILATEFRWARNLLGRLKTAAEKGAERLDLKSLFGGSRK